jgi:hypothetical protein
MFFPLSEWLPAFLLTLAVEAPIVALILRGHEPGLLRLGVLFLFANLATHLGVWYVLTQLFDIGTAEYLVAAEGWAIAGEAVLYLAAIGGLRVRRAVVATLVANLASFLVGRALGSFSPDVLI